MCIRDRADGMLLARVFDNLLTNATRYANEGRFVDLECEAVKDVVIFRVVTHANPIPEDQLEHIFDKLYRMEESRSSETGGSGLGPVSYTHLDVYKRQHLFSRRCSEWDSALSRYPW